MHRVAEIHALDGLRHDRDLLNECSKHGACTTTECAISQRATHRLPQRTHLRARKFAYTFERLVANAARRRVDHALERNVCIRRHRQAQIRQRIANLCAFKEAHAAIDAVGQVAPQERFLQHARLRIRAIQHCDLCCVAAALDPVRCAIGDEARLIQFVVGGIHQHRLAVAFRRPQLLAEPACVVADHRVRGLQNVAAGAVVLFETTHRNGREVALETQNVLDACAAPTVDALVVVAHGHQLAAVTGQQLQPRVLHSVGVLELIDQDLLKARPVVRQHIGPFEPQFVTAQQQFCEVDNTGLCTGGFVGHVDIAEHLFDLTRRVQMPGPLAFVLGAVDVPGRLLGRVTLLIQVHRLHDAFDQPLLIIAIENLKALRQPRFFVVNAQQPMGDAVKRAHPQHVHGHMQQLLDAATHLPRGLVGKGHRQNGVGRNAGFQQVGDAVHEHARLAATGASEHQRMPGFGADCLLLLRIQRGEKLL